MTEDSSPVMLSYAQNFEDVMLARAFKGITDGFFVDVGAWHPEDDSVTCHFYKQGWHGINVEPNPRYLELLRKERTRDRNLGVAVGAEAGRAKLTLLHGTGMSTLYPDVAAKDTADAYEKEIVEVEVRPLNDILAESAEPVIHFLKIDCEGAETAVINALDLARYRPWIILVEATEPLSPQENHHDWEPHLIAGGYDFVYFDGVNRFYVAREKSDLRQHFAVPPNVFDRFTVARMIVPLFKIIHEERQARTLKGMLRRLFGGTAT